METPLLRHPRACPEDLRRYTEAGIRNEGRRFTLTALIVPYALSGFRAKTI